MTRSMSALRLLSQQSFTSAWVGAVPAWAPTMAPGARTLHVSSLNMASQEDRPADSSSTPSTSQPTTTQAASAEPSTATTSRSAAVARSLLAHFDQDDTTAPATPPPSPSSQGRPPVASSAPPVQPAVAQESDARDVISVVLRAVENCKPQLVTKQVKTGNRVSHVPKMVHPRLQRSLAIRWILEAAEKRRMGTPGARRDSMAECLATELLLAAEKKGSARAKRDEMHKLAVEHRANMRR